MAALQQLSAGKMNRFHGSEGIFGVGGGMVTAESMANLDKATELFKQGKPAQARECITAALRDPHNLDASIMLGNLARNTRKGITIIEEAEARGKRQLKERFGPKCFDDDGEQVGRFWDILETRPYMRVLQALERLYFEDRKWAKAGGALEEMLRLRPGDNQYARKWLGTLLIRCGRYSDALNFAQQWTQPGRTKTPERGGTIYCTPYKQPWTAGQVANIHPRLPCELVFTAALASFKLWGDNEQARQFLAIASKMSPNVLIKILGRKTRPSNHYDGPRSLNGPEDAHDYLWYGQDLWMIPDVWNWVDSIGGIKETLLKKCSREDCQEFETSVAEFKRCSACRLVMYCSEACQKTDWKAHKQACKDHKAMKSSIKAFNTGKKVAPGAPGIIAPDFNSDGIVFSATLPRERT